MSIKSSVALSLLGMSILASCSKKSTKTEIDPSASPKVVPVNEKALAFPGAEGYGKETTGGRGGKVIFVTTLEDGNEQGTLRYAINQTGSRIILFKVSGNIILKSRLQIKNGNVTIVGQTAPGDGICIQNYDVNIDADNVIVRYMRFRMGDLTRYEQDAFWGRYHQNIMIDHCSMSWSIDECSSFYANKNFTMQWCLLAESLNKSFHEKDDHGYGGIWGGNGASFHHNLLAHHNSRNPRFDGGFRSGTGVSPVGKDQVDYRNNVIFNWCGNSAYGGENGQYNIVNNYYKPGPATPATRNKRIMQISMETTNPSTYSPGYGSFYINGNYIYGNSVVSADNWNGGVNFDTGVNTSSARSATPFNLTSITSYSAEQAYFAVLDSAGASFKRDAVDARVVDEVRNGTATYNGSKTGLRGIIDSQTDVGGWPVLKQTPSPTDMDGDGMPDAWELSKGLNPNVANANGRELSTAYDNLEVFINSIK
ncbi:pectate lyase family protein [Desertivirga arenae]|uniref:pectate lyase family protein n=1 Tax=Desertivirga arenae TaxID=2810309 RepID=UPI001A95F156|nr:pectate lyase [Pedobacter sp. SYSU D00823]